jgi:hypothetical protein
MSRLNTVKGPQATKSTVLATKLSEPVLAQLALRLAPQQWQSAKNTLRNGLLQSLEKSLSVLERTRDS